MMTRTQESFTFTVGKLDAGMAILLGERAHLIEFPSVLLPLGATAGSIVNISVQQNHAEEKKRDHEFWTLQNDILEKYGVNSPKKPELQLRNVTQTSVTLEWPPLELGTAKLRSLDIFRNHQRIAAIPSPLTNTSTKLSGLVIDKDYSFHLVLKTTAGTYQSNILRVRTHKMTDTSGISVCFGNVQDAVLLENAKMALREMGAKWSDKIQIDTTHFVCTTPAATPTGASASGSISSAPGVEYQKALQLSIPVVQPHWILACHSEKKMIPIQSYYLGASSSTPISSAPFSRPQSMSQANLPSPSRSSTGGGGNSPTQAKHPHPNRQSMPAPNRVTSTSPPASSFINQSQHQIPPHIEPTLQEENESDDDEGSDVGAPEQHHEQHERLGNASEEEEALERAGRARKGTMSRNFKFPPTTSDPPPMPADLPPIPPTEPEPVHEHVPKGSKPAVHTSTDTEEAALVVAPSTVEVPPPPPVEKERSPSEMAYEDVGETEEISLN